MPELNKENLSFIVQTATLLIIVIIAIVFRKEKKKAIIASIILAFIANLVAQLVIMGGGPSLCIGSILLPIYGVILAYVTIYIAGHLESRIRRKQNLKKLNKKKSK